MPGAAKSGSGSVSDSTPALRPVPFVALAPAPSPRRANASHSSAWFAPPNRSVSAASIELRASTIDGAVGSSRYESNSSWIQRRLPGQRSTGTSPRAHCSCSAWSPSGYCASYFAASALRMSKFVAVQISPSAWTCGPVTS